MPCWEESYCECLCVEDICGHFLEEITPYWFQFFTEHHVIQVEPYFLFPFVWLYPTSNCFIQFSNMSTFCLNLLKFLSLGFYEVLIVSIGLLFPSIYYFYSFPSSLIPLLTFLHPSAHTYFLLSIFFPLCPFFYLPSSSALLSCAHFMKLIPL